jgi:hypothetical protein
VSHMAQGASRAAPECISRLDHSSTAPARCIVPMGLDLEAAALVNELVESRRLPYSRAPAPGRTPRELARSGSGALRTL